MIDLLEEVDPEPPSLPSTVFFERKGREVLLKGRVANEVLRRQVAEIAYQIPTVRTVVNDLEVAERAFPVPDARLAASFGAIFIREAETGYFEWSTEKFVMRGAVPSASVRNRMEAQLKPLLHGRTLHNHLTVSSVTPEAGRMVVINGGNGREEGLLRGSVGSAELRAKAVLAARKLAPEIDWRDELSVAPDQVGSTSEGFANRIRAFLSARGGEERGFYEEPDGTIVILGVFDPEVHARMKRILQHVPVSANSESAMPHDATRLGKEQVAQLKAGLARLPIHFAKNQDTAVPDELRKVIQAYELLTAVGYQGGIVVAGYADAGTNSVYNKVLSLRRAEGIREEFVSLGVALDRIDVDSIGPVQGVKPDKELGSERRVEIRLRD